jgi:hypothetical protein
MLPAAASVNVAAESNKARLATDLIFIISPYESSRIAPLVDT